MLVSALRAFGVSLVLMLAWSAVKAQDADPVYEEKKASEWVKIVRDDPSARKRSLAIVALGKLCTDQKYKPALAELGRSVQLDQSAAVRVQAAATIATLKLEDAKTLENALLDALKNDKESRVKREIAATLGQFPEIGKRAVPLLTPLLKDPDAATRAAAADTLGRIGTDAKGAAPGLIPLVEDADKTVRHAAIVALGRIAPENPSFVAAALVKVLTGEKDADMRRDILVSLGLLGDRSEPVVSALAAALADADEENRAVAVRTLGTFGTAARPAADALLKHAREAKEKGTRIDAVRAFGSALGPDLKGRLKDLIQLLEKEPEFEVRVAIVEEIGALGNDLKDDKDTLAALRKRLSDPQVKVREAAAAAIRRIEKKAEKPPEKKP